MESVQDVNLLSRILLQPGQKEVPVLLNLSDQVGGILEKAVFAYGTKDLHKQIPIV